MKQLAKRGSHVWFRVAENLSMFDERSEIMGTYVLPKSLNEVVNVRFEQAGLERRVGARSTAVCRVR